jgi:hypothetical protein
MKRYLISVLVRSSFDEKLNRILDVEIKATNKGKDTSPEFTMMTSSTGRSLDPFGTFSVAIKDKSRYAERCFFLLANIVDNLHAFKNLAKDNLP